LAADLDIRRRPEPVEDALPDFAAPVGDRLDEVEILGAALVAGEAEERHYRFFLPLVGFAFAGFAAFLAFAAGLTGLAALGRAAGFLAGVAATGAGFGRGGAGCCS